MKKQSIWVFTALSLFHLVSCTQDADNLISEKNELKEEIVSENNLDELLAISSSPQRSKEEALAIARQFSSTSTRSNSMTKSQFHNDFEIDVVLADKAPKTYSTSSDEIVAVDTMLYVLNRKDDNGFFIISGDKRLPDLLCHSFEGHLDKDNVDDNSGFSVFLSRLPAYYQSTLDKFYARLDSLESLEQEMEDDEPLTYKRRRRPRYRYEYSEWKEVSRTSNLVPVEWGQGSPYNDEAVIIKGERAAAGCVAIAAAQLISSFKYPYSYKGISLNWDLLTKHPSYYYYAFDERNVYAKQVAPLLRKIGDKLGNRWGLAEEDGTGAYTKDIPSVLREMGYKYPSRLTSFDENGVISSIAQKKTVILDGYAETYKKGWFIFKKRVYDHGHAWISDGYLRQERTVKKIRKATNTVVETKTESRTLLHCNWGWSGRRNGYFLPKVFDSNNPVIRDGRRTRSYSYTPYYYQYKIGNILYIHP